MPAASSMKAASHGVAKTTGVGGPYTMIEAATHAMGEAMLEFAVPAIVGSIGTVREISVIAVVVGLISVARQGTAVSGIVYVSRRAGVPVGVGLRSSRLRSSKASRRQPNTGANRAALIENLLQIIAASFGASPTRSILKWQPRSTIN
jgi:hypothetical protein